MQKQASRLYYARLGYFDDNSKSVEEVKPLAFGILEKEPYMYELIDEVVRSRRFFYDRRALINLYIENDVKLPGMEEVLETDLEKHQELEEFIKSKKGKVKTKK